MTMPKIRLVDDWKRAWRWVSVNCMVLAAAIQGAWVYVPDDMRESLPHNLVSGLTICVLVLGVIGRICKKEDKKNVDVGAGCDSVDKE